MRRSHSFLVVISHSKIVFLIFSICISRAVITFFNVYALCKVQQHIHSVMSKLHLDWKGHDVTGTPINYRRCSIVCISMFFKTYGVGYWYYFISADIEVYASHVIYNIVNKLYCSYAKRVVVNIYEYTLHQLFYCLNSFGNS